ncbi:Hsp70 family protein [[Mycobacterium] wendilense]|uniref:Hsp70 family protein n=1 Tax=[Mycobacterium] wendilense TaxID=3064284 RepID=A0ABM9MCQ2_9MYCO|nr:Hsp70 family protein [Mycolicibacterium sp. MU0050]CAJ1582008.1 Hsp70 family protein [Mycolicibacterium sp. MU0050]
MTDETRLAVGLSVGTTTLTAVTSDNAVRRPPVLTVGEATITDFVDRVGDPVGILAADGSSHRAERVLAEALRQTAYAATRGRPLPALTAVAVPAYWRPSAVQALSGALARIPEWTRRPPTVLSEVTAATTALQHDPGLPTRGVVALCDVGGGGTTITLLDAGRGHAAIGAPVRHPDFSGDLVDQALLTHVIDELAGAGSVDLASTSAIGSLWRLRAQCRGAKERLSGAAVTSMPAELPEFRGDVRITRNELDAVLRAPLADLLAALDEALSRNGVHPADLAAVASVGGGAAMAAVTTALSDHLRVPVITSARPALTAATGAALRALRGPDDDTATKVAAVLPAPAAAAPSAEPTVQGALAWSQAEDGPVLPDDDPYEESPDTGLSSARPAVAFETADVAAEPALRWYRRPAATMVAASVVLIGAVSAVGVVLVNDSGAVQVSDPTPSISTAPQPVPVVAQPPAEEPPAPQPVVQQPARGPAPAPVTRTRVVQQQAPAPAAPEPPAPVTSTVTETVTPPPPSSQEPAPQEPPPPAQQPEPEPPAQQPAPQPDPPAPEPEPEPAPEAPAPTHPRWIPTVPPIPTIPGLPPLIPQPPPAG